MLYELYILTKTVAACGLAPWRSGIAPESIGGVYGHNAFESLLRARTCGYQLRHYYIPPALTAIQALESPIPHSYIYLTTLSIR
jgi:hypothetical protein